MKGVPITAWISFNNILYIGDEPRECIAIIEKFNKRLLEIERDYPAWFNNDNITDHEKLQRHIQYHFEGGIAIFKFKNEDDVPDFIRKECITACRSLVYSQLFYAS